MNRIYVILFLVLASIQSQAQIIHNVETEAREVRIFMNQAQVSRVAKVKLEKGQQEIVVSQLSDGVQAHSIQAELTGHAVLMGVKFNLDYLSGQKPGLRQKQLQDSLKFLIEKRDENQAELRILQLEETFYTANQKISGGEVNLTVVQLRQMADFFNQKMKDIQFSRLQKNREGRELQEKIENLQKQIDEEKTGPKTRGQVIISVSSAQPQIAELRLSYIVNNAGWQPVYDIRSAGPGSELQLQYKAGVRQYTGEDWSGVKLTLSSGNPAQGGQKPDLHPWYIDFGAKFQELKRDNRAMSRAMPAEVADDAEIQMDVEVFLDVPVTSQPPPVSIETDMQTEYSINLPYDLPGNGREVMVDIRTESMEAVYRYEAVPLIDRDAFLMASITNWKELNLLPGEAGIYLNGIYSGRSFIDPGSTEDTLTFSLGRDKRIIIERKMIQQMSSKRSIGSNIRVTRAYEIDIRNSTGKEVEIKIEDRVPVSRNRSISVDVKNTGGARLNTSTGLLQWNLLLKPEERTKLAFDFEVRYPKDEFVPGL
ncbi:MAG: DUF4139 domain-containing protein [Cyclobacteriaceae bacterium]|nr:DUF4139 domain-containing protein [Cyclobacteriaceae bacterium]